MDRDKDTIFDILHAGQLIQQFKAGMTQAEFRQDPKTQSAILHQITVMGEAVKRLSLAFRSQPPRHSLAVNRRDARFPHSCR